MSKFVLLNEEDNVFICCQAANAGEALSIGKLKINLSTDIEVGHKVARKNLSIGQKIIRYGVPIGSAIHDIAIGDHVHMHNMKSDYIPSHTRQIVSGE